MNVNELVAGLSRITADPEVVLASLGHKKRVRRRRRIGMTASLACVLAAAVVVTWSNWPTRTAPAVIVSSPAQAADGCFDVPIATVLSDAKSLGASVVVAHGQLTGHTAIDGVVFNEMMLDHVQTLSGPDLGNSTVGWIQAADALWGPDGRLLAVVIPQGKSGTHLGRLIQPAPIVNGNVILSRAGCWFPGTIPTTAFTGNLASVPGSLTYDRAKALGFSAVPLSAIEAIT